MLLKNKKTGEVTEFKSVDLYKGYGVKLSAKSLAELNEEWEDAPEEPKEWWYIDADGELLCDTSDDRCEFDNNCREIGNYFSSMEEAEKAAERLRAWKRLRDYNVKFNLDFVRNRIDFTYSVNNPLLGVLDGEEQIFNNMKIVFGGEE